METAKHCGVEEAGSQRPQLLVQAASVLAAGATARVIHDRGFSRMTELQVLSWHRVTTGSQHRIYSDIINIIDIK